MGQVSSGDLSGHVLVKSPSPWDSDDRGMFCLYLFPGTTKHKQIFRRRVVFVIDISGSMKWKPLEDVKKALLESLAKLEPEDVFNIIAFNDNILEFSTKMEFATDETISAVTEWLDSNLVASGGTNMLLPLIQVLATKLLEGSKVGVPLVYLVTDGSVENEREICNAMKECCSGHEKSISPRISTFGIGSFCNHYFLQMLARIGNGYYDGTNNTDSFEHQMSRLFDSASNTIVANTTFDALKLLRSVELFPSQIPDITLGQPLILSGRYEGQFPDEVELRGTLADMSCFTIELTVEKAKDIPLDKVLARRQIDELTAQAWFEDKKELQDKVSSGDLSGHVLVKSPSPWDSDDRGMFCLYLFPGTTKHKQIFRGRVVFVIDISGSMKWKPLEDVKKALLESLAKLEPEDVFNIIAFNDNILEFSTKMELATDETISAVTEWLDSNLIASGGTNMLLPLIQVLAMKLLEGSKVGVPLVYLVTDGSVDNEREICNAMKECCSGHEKSISPRISTFGIGSFCNHYFLQMLARIGNGYYDGTNNTDSFEHQMSRLFDSASSTIVANTTFDALKLLRSVELFPSQIPDITLGQPLILSGRYKGQFPDEVELRGTLADMSCFTIELTVEKAKDIPLDKVLARRQIDELTAQAWFEDKKELQDKVMRLSIQTGFPSEYTQMVLSLKDNDEEKTIERPVSIKEILRNPSYQIHKQMSRNVERTSLLGKQGFGFGNLAATLKNIPPWMEEPKEPEGAEILIRAASGVVDRVCCMCCLQCLSRVSDQCTIVFSQICAALACFQCLGCCFEVCGCLDL
ncbi:hypothetical protein F2Q70_00045329 [Brassica cretica]|uniref:VWFA domain-containing protein n=1 Tax=Brassica cretica TaxID=69181 RepID=A0A8S9KJE5_BRACR|nr:hypothetical protein F2Q70_00045329 [Brassica cretica]